MFTAVLHIVVHLADLAQELGGGDAWEGRVLANPLDLESFV